MTETPPERRLAAIVAADVVSYSRLMGEDEVGTLAALRQLRRELYKKNSFRSTTRPQTTEFYADLMLPKGAPEFFVSHSGASTRDMNMIFRYFQFHHINIVVITDFLDDLLQRFSIGFTNYFMSIFGNPDKMVHQAINMMSISLQLKLTQDLVNLTPGGLMLSY